MRKRKSLFPRFPRTAGSHGHRARVLGSVPETCHGAPLRGRGTAQSGLAKGCVWKGHSKTFRLLLSKMEQTFPAYVELQVFSEVFKLATFE